MMFGSAPLIAIAAIPLMVKCTADRLEQTGTWENTRKQKPFSGAMDCSIRLATDQVQARSPMKNRR